MRFAVVVCACLVLFGMGGTVWAQSSQSGSGASGIQGTLSAPPPTTGATISIPGNGQTFTQLPITVSGLCPKGLLVKIFKNNVFSGSVECQSGSYSILIDLFNGQNELVARVYDALDQAGPDSNKVIVTFSDNRPGAGSRPTLTSNFAKRGANPGEELIWPIILSGGSGPYAVSIDWGDGKPAELKSLSFPGPFDIKHVYDSPGVYNVVVKVTDKDGGSAFLQLVAIANGPLSQENQKGGDKDKEIVTVILWQPAAFMIALVALAFWLGERYKLKVIRKKLENGEQPF
jgi:hypothetical protein